MTRYAVERRSAIEDRLLGGSAEAGALRAAIARVADVRDPVLITGETGAGKEVVARAIHAAGARRREPFVAVNMSALAEGTLESELFGHERGAFTGAVARRIGRFELAHRGTLLLDEIGDAPPRVQAELLRVVEHQRFERLGGTRSIRVDVRILAATHRHLASAIARGGFRQDLWYRLSALRIHVPPLRERPADVAPLVRAELEALSAERGGPPFEIDEGGLEQLASQPWPGNVRELRLSVRRMALLAGGRRRLTAADVAEALHCDAPLPSAFPLAPEPLRVADGAGQLAERRAASRGEFESRERERILEALNERRWNVSAAARALGLSRSSLRHRMRRLGIGEVGGGG